MNDFEKDLGQLPLAAPSPDLDRRIGAAFAATRPRARPAVWWWAAAATLAGAAAIAFLVSRRPLRPPANQVVYRIEAAGPLRQFLVDPPAARTPPPPLVVRTAPF